MSRKSIVWAGFVAAFLLQNASGQVPELLGIGPESPALGSGRIPAIAVDRLGQPHIVADGGSMIYMYDKVGTNWRSLVKNAGSLVNSPQFFNPAIEIDSRDRAWISGVTWLPAGGVGVIVRTDMSRNPSDYGRFPLSRAGARYPVGLLSIDPAFPNEAIVMGTAGGWQRAVYENGSTRLADMGTLPFGAGGEKTAFWISKAGSVAHADGSNRAVWHGAMGGYYGDYSAYINSMMHARGQGRVVWANYPNYPTMKDDGSYVRVVSDNLQPEVAYITCDFSAGGRHPGAGIGMNIYNGSGMNFPPNNILFLDRAGTAGIRRLAPQSTPALNGGVFVVWTRAGRVKMRYVPPTARSINDCGPEWDIAEGGPAAVATDADGNVHLAYTRDSRVYYRMLEFADAKSGFSVAMDFTGDGKDNVATYDARSSRFNILRANGTSYSVQLGRAGDIPAPGYYETPNKANVAVFRPAEGRWFIRLHNGSIMQAIVLGDRDSVPVPMDYTGDGLTDPAVVNLDTLEWTYRDRRNGSTESTRFGWVNNDVPMPLYYESTNRVNLAVYRPATSEWVIRLHNGSTITIQHGWAGKDLPVPADYNGDGLDDLAVYRPVGIANGGKWFIRQTGGTSVVSWPGAREAVAVPGDYDGDGKHDLAFFNEGRWSILSSASGNTVRLGKAPVRFGGGSDRPVAGYFAETNAANVAIYRPGSGQWIIRSNSPGASRVERFGGAGDIPLEGNFIGGPLYDFALFRPRDRTWHIRSNAGGDQFSVRFGGMNDLHTPGDYDGDGLIDIAVYRPASGGEPATWLIYQPDDEPLRIPFGSVRDVPVPGRYTTNTQTDIAVYRPSDGNKGGEWRIRQSDGTVTTNELGWVGDRPKPFDYTGDGIDELAVFRPSTGEWLIETSTGRVVHVWGGSRDMPKTADFTGDGKEDIAVYRNGQWHIRQSEDGTKRIDRLPFRFGGEKDYPIGQNLYISR